MFALSQSKSENKLINNLTNRRKTVENRQGFHYIFLANEGYQERRAMGDSLQTNVPVINKFRSIFQFWNAKWELEKFNVKVGEGFGIRMTGKFGLGGNFRPLLFWLQSTKLRDREMDRVAPF